MKVLLLQLDGKIPNLALMRIAAHHRNLGDDVDLHRGVMQNLWSNADRVYASLIFEKTRWKAEQLLRDRPDAIVGGTGWDLATTLESVGITTRQQDYSIYPNWPQSIGFTQRGCSLNCTFCVVPVKEGKARPEATIDEIWRGDPWPRELLLLDNDFFARQNDWRARVKEILDGDFKVSFNQGVNARMLNDETAAALASMKCYDDNFKHRQIYTAWDSRGDERVLFRGLNALKANGVRPRNVIVYMLIGYDHRLETGRPHLVEDDFYRRECLRAWGALPFPMPYVRSNELLNFQRWIVGAFDKKIPWETWKQAKGQPRNLTLNRAPEPALQFE